MKMDPEYKQAFKGLSTNELKNMWNELAPPRIRTPLRQNTELPSSPVPTEKPSMLNYVVRDCMVDDEGRMAIFCFQDTMLGRLERLATGSLNLSHLGALIDYRSLLQRQFVALDREIHRLEGAGTVGTEEAKKVIAPLEIVSEDALIELDVVEEPQLVESQEIRLQEIREINAAKEPSDMQQAEVREVHVTKEPSDMQQADIHVSNEDLIAEKHAEETQANAPPTTPLSQKYEDEENIESNYNTQNYVLPAYSNKTTRMESSDWETTTNGIMSTPMTIKDFVSPDEDHPTPLPAINEQKRRRLMERLQQSRATGDAEKCLIQ